jgi:spermidine/putrescine transport system substrate-binding protein
VLAAAEFLEQQNTSGQIRKFTGNEYTTDLAKGNVALAIAWSGDMIQLEGRQPRTSSSSSRRKGGMLWSDNMLIPQKAPSPYGAEVLMNYVYDPEVAAKIAAYVNYVTPVAAAKDGPRQGRSRDGGNELIFPEASTLEKLSVFTDLSVEDEQQMNESFQAVVGG